jgi:hypothetical protein
LNTKINDIKKVIKLFDSNLWKSLKHNKVGINVSYDICKTIFGSNKVIFFQNGIATYDDSKSYSELKIILHLINIKLL